MNSSESRQTILEAVRAAKPPAVALPASRSAAASEAGGLSQLDAFCTAATAGGAEVIVAPQHDVRRLLNGAHAETASVLSTIPELHTTSTRVDQPHALQSLDLFVCRSELGVAENGALWLATSDPMYRAALFLAQRVAIVVERTAIVPTMHDAYARIDLRAHLFGVFVAGPSKTADIEQSLVIGAHGPKALMVIVVQ